MRKWLIKFIDLILYSNLWIAVAALAMSMQTQYLLLGKVSYTPYLPFVFFGSLFLYALHRIIGLEKAKPFQEKGRYWVIATFKRHIQLYAAISSLFCIYFFFFLPFFVQLNLLIPALLALAYVIPMFKGKKTPTRFSFYQSIPDRPCLDLAYSDPAGLSLAFRATACHHLDVFGTHLFCIRYYDSI